MGEHDEDQEHGAEPARPPLTEARAREMTAGLREAMDDVRRSVAVLAARVRDAHAARVWAPLGHSSWETYCRAEFGISRAQAYRLLDVARALAAIHGRARRRHRDVSHARHRPDGRGRARLRPVPARPDRRLQPRGRRRGALITHRLATLAHSGLADLDEPTVRAVVRQAVRDVRTAPPPPPADPPADPAVAALRAAVDDLAANTHAIGELMLEVDPAYFSDTEGADVLALLCDQIGEPLDHGLAARRYAMSGDRRALHGTVLWSAASRLPLRTSHPVSPGGRRKL